MAETQGLLRVVSPEELQAQEESALEEAQQLREEEATAQDMSSLRAHIQRLWAISRDHRSTRGINDRLLASLRAFNGVYEQNQLAEIQKFGGSEVYARIVGTKARSATALLRDVYFSSDRPWDLEATPTPTLPDDITEGIPKLVMMEAQSMAQAGQPIDPGMIKQRMDQLMKAAENAARKKADDDAVTSTRKVDDYLVEGGFYEAFSAFLMDLPLFPFAIIKGPAVKMIESVKWEQGKAVISKAPRMVWDRVSPFDFYWTPGVSHIAEGDTFERLRWTRKNLHDLLGLPGWNEEAIRGAIEKYDSGLRDWMDAPDSERSIEEDREDPNWNRSDMIDAMEFHGNIRGKMLLDWGFDPNGIQDSELDYHVQAWMCGEFVLKVQLSPSPRKRHPYFMTSFEKVPGTPVGNSLVDVLSDISEVGNAALRNLVNNMGMASGPQVVILDNRFAVNEDTDDIYPWKRWHMADEPGQGALPPVSFYQPQSNANELLGIYQKMTEIADEISAIPRYATGSGASGGAGRTASGLSMLMGNANKILQQVAHNIDMDILTHILQSLYDLLMLTGSKAVTGDESIVVRGVSTVAAKETERARQLEFLQLTANEIDMSIIGPEGRAQILRAVADDLGMPVDQIVPSKDMIAEREAKNLEQQRNRAAADAASDSATAGANMQNDAQAQQMAQQMSQPANSTSPVENNVTPGNNTGGI